MTRIHHVFRLGAALAALVAVSAACTPRLPESNPEFGQCGAAGYQHLVGQDRAVLQTMRFGTNVRILEPNSPATTDYRVDRLNILIDDSGRIKSVSCG